MSIVSIFKISFLTLIFISIIVLITVEKPIKTELSNLNIDMSQMPKSAFLLNDSKTYITNSVIKNRTLIMVVNNNSSYIMKSLEKFLKYKNIVVILSVSDMPWFMKKWFLISKYKKFVKNIEIPWIYDEHGNFENFLKFKLNSGTSYEIYLYDEKIHRIYKKKILNSKMNEIEIDLHLKQLNKDINNKI